MFIAVSCRERLREYLAWKSAPNHPALTGTPPGEGNFFIRADGTLHKEGNFFVRADGTLHKEGNFFVRADGTPPYLGLLREASSGGLVCLLPHS